LFQVFLKYLRIDLITRIIQNKTIITENTANVIGYIWNITRIATIKNRQRTIKITPHASE
jgi:hypothetical protein